MVAKPRPAPAASATQGFSNVGLLRPLPPSEKSTVMKPEDGKVHILTGENGGTVFGSRQLNNTPILNRRGVGGLRSHPPAENNPFRVPEGNIMVLGKTLKEEKMKDRAYQKTLSVRDRPTFSSMMKTVKLPDIVKRKDSRSSKSIRPLSDRGVQALCQNQPTDQNKREILEYFKTQLKKDPHKAEKHCDHRSVQQYMSDIRECTRINLAISYKKEEMCRLDQQMSMEEKNICDENKKLKEAQACFTESLNKSKRALLKAEKEAQDLIVSNLEHDTILRSKKEAKGALENEIKELKETVKKLNSYKEFLLNLSPPEWRDKANKNPEDPHIYFKDPEQLLDYMNELEEEIRYQYMMTSEMQEEVSQEKLKLLDEERRLKETVDPQLPEQNKLSELIKRETEKLEEIKLHVQAFIHRQEKDSKMLKNHQSKLQEMHRSCGFTLDNTEPEETLKNMECIVGEHLEGQEYVPKVRFHKTVLKKEKLRLQKQKLLQQQKTHK